MGRLYGAQLGDEGLLLKRKERQLLNIFEQGHLHFGHAHVGTRDLGSRGHLWKVAVLRDKGPHLGKRSRGSARGVPESESQR